MVLIKSAVEEENFEGFVKRYEDLVATWFYDIRQLSPGLVTKERDAWIRCQGVPLHAWSTEIFLKN